LIVTVNKAPAPQLWSTPVVPCTWARVPHTLHLNRRVRINLACSLNRVRLSVFDPAGLLRIGSANRVVAFLFSSFDR
jgi:hypothetical protein